MLIDPDFDWELFPRPPDETPGGRAWAIRAAVAAGVVGCWFVDRPLAVAAACVAMAFEDIRDGRRLARAIPDPAGARICSRFRYAWGAWKVGAAGFGLMFATLPWMVRQKDAPPPLECILAMLAWMLGFLVSAGLTAAGMYAALRSGMRVWIGEGVNRARTLLLGMIVSAFTLGVLIPCFVWMTDGAFGERTTSGPSPAGPFFAFLGLLFVAPVAILILLERISRRVVAERPGKFGPKVPSVGKWNA